MRTLSTLPALLGLALLGLALAPWPASAGPPPALRAALDALVDLEGAPAPLGATLEESAGVVLVFFGTRCPCVRRYQGRVEALRRDYEAQGVRVYWIASNADDSQEALAAVAKARGVKVPLLQDPGGRLAQALGARTTPTAALLGPGGDLRFLGWIDNERLPGVKGRQPYLERALDALLAGGRASSRAPIYGCAITRSLSQPHSCATPEPK